jgi:hypothetical protein
MKGRHNPRYGYIRRSYEVAISLTLAICGTIAGYLVLGSLSGAAGGFSAGYFFARGLYWLIYYFVEGKKRPWQFDLRSAFFVMTLAAVLLGIIAVLMRAKS